MRLQEIMTTAVISIGPDETADAAWSRMKMEGIRHLVVKDGRHLMGVLSERDLGGRNGSALRRGRTVRELMPARLVTAKPSTTLREAANLMRGQLIGSLPVVKDNRVVGIVTAIDVLDELGKGSTRPAMKAQRQSMRLPPASAREAKRKGARKRAPRATTKRGKPARAGATGDDPAKPPQARLAAESTVDAETPAFIRAVGTGLGRADRAYLRRKLGRKLGKFARAIERVSIRVDDVNGPRGGVDQRCRIKVVMTGLPSVFVEERHHSLQAAMDIALTRVQSSVRSALQRRRSKRNRASSVGLDAGT